jgi:hypothetical protein
VFQIETITASDRTCEPGAVSAITRQGTTTDQPPMVEHHETFPAMEQPAATLVPVDLTSFTIE